MAAVRAPTGRRVMPSSRLSGNGVPDGLGIAKRLRTSVTPGGTHGSPGNPSAHRAGRGLERRADRCGRRTSWRSGSLAEEADARAGDRPARSVWPGVTGAAVHHLPRHAAGSGALRRPQGGRGEGLREAPRSQRASASPAVMRHLLRLLGCGRPGRGVPSASNRSGHPACWREVARQG